MKVVHLSCVAPPQIGGIGRVAATEVERLRARGLDAALVSPGNIPVRWSFGNAASLDRKCLLDRVRDADIVHLHYPFYGTAGDVAKMRREGEIKRLAITLHMDATATGLKGLVFDLHRMFLQRRTLDAADALFASSKDYVEHASFAPWADRVIELPFGVDEERFKPAQRDVRNPQLERTVVFVGGMDQAHAFKGVDVLLRAFVELPRNTHLILAGDGDLRPGFERLARELGIAERTTFLGRVAEADLPGVYRRGDVLAFPSTSGAEAFGLVALEAQACGVPVVASDLPGVRTVVADKETGFLTPAGHAPELAAHLRLLLENPEMRDAFGVAARARILERFTWSRHIDGLVAVYQKLCASPS